MAGTIQDVKVDGALHVHQLRREARYWEPANDLGDCGVVTAAKSLPGVSGWLGSERLAEVYRLIPWYPFPCVDGDWIQRRQDLLQPVRQGNHFPVFRVNPKQPWTLSLAVSVLSPVLDHPSGCSALNGSGDEMWWERVAPLGWRQDTVSICDSPMAVGGLPDVDAVVWGSTQPAMTQEAAVTDCCAFRGACGLLADILPAPPDPDALPRHIPPGELQLIRDMVVQLSRLLETAMQPFLAFGFGYDLTGTQETIASTFGDGIEAARNQLMQPFLAELPARLASCYLWDALHQHLQRSAEWLAESSKSSPTWPSRVAAQWPSLAHRGGASVDPGAYLRAVTASALAELDPYARSPAGRLVESLCNAFRGLEGHILIEPMRWVSGASSMHLSRRLGLLVDPAEFRETYTDLNANSWNWGRNADITILAHDVNGAALAFAKRMDQGFVTVVPAGFPDEAVLALVREAADHWQVHVPGLESAAEPCDRATPRPGSPDGERRFALKDLVVTVEAEGAADIKRFGPAVEGAVHRAEQQEVERGEELSGPARAAAEQAGPGYGGPGLEEARRRNLVASRASGEGSRDRPGSCGIQDRVRFPQHRDPASGCPCPCREWIRRAHDRRR